MRQDHSFLRYALFIFIILLPFAVFFWQIPFISPNTIGNDYVAFSILNQIDLQQSLKHGTFPLYVPGYGGGMTALGLTLGGMFHPFFYIAPLLPGYWDGNALLWNTLLRLFSLGIAHLILFNLLRRLRLNNIFAFIISFITVYNLRMLDVFRYGASLESYTALLFLCASLAFYFLKPTRFIGPASIILSTYLMICGGHPQIMYLSFLGVAIATLFIPFIIPKITEGTEVNHPSRLKYFMVTSSAILTGILLSAAYIVPFYYDFLTINAARVGQDYQWSLSYSDFLSGFLNSFFNPLQSDVHGAFGSSALIIPIILAPLIVIFREKIPFSVWMLWATLILIFLCALGKETPIHYYFWKYFPFANVFRAPGRITIVFPFLFLLLAAWMLRYINEKIKIRTREIPISPLIVPVLIAILLFIIYPLFIAPSLHAPGVYTPSNIQAHPSIVDSVIPLIGFFTLFLFLFYLLQFKSLNFLRKLASFLLIGFVFTQVSLQIRYGTWIIKNEPSPSIEILDAQKKKNLNKVLSLDPTMESVMVATQKKKSIVDPMLAKFYRNYECVSDQESAYRFLLRENTTRSTVVEIPLADTNLISESPGDDTGYDWVVLDYNTYNSVRFIARAGAPGFFTLSFSYTSHWSAFVDGNPSPVYRANGYMQAVFLSPGQHVITFRYWSKAAFIGLFISCFTFFLSGVFFFFVLRSKKGFIRAFVLILSIVIPAGVLAAWYTHLYNGENLGTEYTWNSKQFVDFRNLAYAKKTDMSSGVYGNNYAGLAVDGNYGRSFQTERDKNQWWQIDLGKPHSLGEIILTDKSFSGKAQLPLHILGGMNGKDFETLAVVSQRGNEIPWRISLAGQMAQVIRLQSPAKTSLSFGEIEIFPPAGQIDESPLQMFIQSKPITSKTIDLIHSVSQAATSDNVQVIRSIFEMKNNNNPETLRILKFETLGKALERGCTKVLAFFRDSKAGNNIPLFVTEAEPRRVIDLYMSSSLKSPGDKVYSVWKKEETHLEKLSPMLFTLSQEGEFKFDLINENGKNIFIVKNINPGSNGKRKIQFGFDSNKFIGDKLPEGYYVNFIVKVGVSSHLVMDDRNFNGLIISQFRNGKWRPSKTFITSSTLRTHIVSRRINPASTQVLVLIQFFPRSSNDELRIENAEILITKRPL